MGTSSSFELGLELAGFDGMTMGHFGEVWNRAAAASSKEREENAARNGVFRGNIHKLWKKHVK